MKTILIAVLASAAFCAESEKPEISADDRLKALELSNEMFRARDKMAQDAETMKRLMAMNEALAKATTDAYQRFIKDLATRLGYAPECVLNAKLAGFVLIKDGKSTPCEAKSSK